MKKAQLIWVLASIALVAVFATYLYYQTFVILSVQTINADVVVKGNGGINLNKDRMHFGGVPPGDGAIRKVTINYTRDAVVHITTDGPLQAFVSASENDFYLAGHENKEITFTADIPLNTSYGNYSGTLIFTFVKP